MRSVYTCVLWTNLISNAGYNARLQKILKNVSFVKQIAYFCIRPNKRRGEKGFCLLFLATFEKLSIQKATFDFFWSNFWAPFWEISGTFLGNLEQALVVVKGNSAIIISSTKERERLNIKITTLSAAQKFYVGHWEFFLGETLHSYNAPFHLSI